jgi:N-acetylglutamate synthase-like GNAT family acetyltransferase
MFFDIASVAAALQPGFKLSVESSKFSLVLRDADGQVIGSVEGFSTATWILVSRLEVAEPLRRTGIGACILRQLEELAVVCGCHTCHVSMFEFSGRGFFEKLGYATFPADGGNQGDVPRLYLAKKLSPARAALREAA